MSLNIDEYERATVDAGKWNALNWGYSMTYHGPAVSLKSFALKDLWFSQVRRTEY